MSMSLIAERALADVNTYGRALLKFISPNNVGLTGSHECGYYLPKDAWRYYSPHPPTKGDNAEHLVDITWQDGRVTQSRIIWYGNKTRSEYRLTRFGRDFPWLTSDNVGDLLVLIFRDPSNFIAYVLDKEEDIETLFASLGLEVGPGWAVYDRDLVEAEDEDSCISRKFREFAGSVAECPGTQVFSNETISALEGCIRGFGSLSPDKCLQRLVLEEYRLFQIVERKLCQNEVTRPFKSIDDFITVAMRIVNRRKARAGRSLENHVEYLLTREAIPFSMRPAVDGNPDVIIPSREAYEDHSYPVERLCVLGIKTTCKDRWRQVTREGKRVPRKHLLTMQPGISKRQLDEMSRLNVSLIVPRPLHKMYPKDIRKNILTVQGFLDQIKEMGHANG